MPKKSAQIDLVEEVTGMSKPQTIEEKKAKNREYQRKYRQKAKNRIVIDENGKKSLEKAELSRLDLYLSIKTKQALTQLAYDSGQSKADVLERLILKAYMEEGYTI